MTARLLQGDTLARLAELPAESVHCVVTSPPYWGLRDYQIEPQWWGGDPDCAHRAEVETVERQMRRGLGLKDSPAATRGGAKKCAETPAQAYQHGFCDRCGAWLGCFGLEPTPELYIEHAVEIFREIRRVLRRDGTAWVNMGDSYHTGASGFGRQGTTGQRYGRRHTQPNLKRGFRSEEIKPKDLVGVPWMLAFALRADGWYLRQDIIWAKPNPMPESVRDRCTKAHEYLFLLSKSRRYYWNRNALLEKASPDSHARYARGRSDNHKWADGGPGNQTIVRSFAHMLKPGVNPKAVAGWATGAGDHSAIGHAKTAAGRHGKMLSQQGRVVNANLSSRHRPRQNPRFSAAVVDVVEWRNKRSVWSVATEPFSEAHFATFPQELVRTPILAGCPEGGLVLDPFCGSGTVGVVALRFNRRFLGIELNPAYVAMAERRIRGDRPLLNAVEVIP